MDLSFVPVCSLILIIFYALMLGSTSGCPKNGYSLTANYTKKYIRSPNYPDNYPRPSSCKWTIEAIQGDVIVFQFLHFDLEASIFCYKDSLSIIDGHTGFHYELLSMCGSYDKTDVLHKTSEPAAIVSFTGVYNGDRNKGFEILFWGEDFAEPDFREPEYEAINYVLFGLCLVILVLTLYAMRKLVVVHARLQIRHREEDEAMTERRILQIYHNAKVQKPVVTKGQ